MNPAQRAGVFFGFLGLGLGVVSGETVRSMTSMDALLFGIVLTSFFLVTVMWSEKTPNVKEPEQP